MIAIFGGDYHMMMMMTIGSFIVFVIVSIVPKSHIFPNKKTSWKTKKWIQFSCQKRFSFHWTHTIVMSVCEKNSKKGFRKHIRLNLQHSCSGSWPHRNHQEWSIQSRHQPSKCSTFWLGLWWYGRLQQPNFWLHSFQWSLWSDHMFLLGCHQEQSTWSCSHFWTSESEWQRPQWLRYRPSSHNRSRERR